MAQIEIRTQGPTVLTAPSLVWFEATGLTGFDVVETPDGPHDPSFSRITYVWTLEGKTPPRYAAPNIPDAWNRVDRAHGKHVAFVLTEENTEYRVRLWAIDETGHVAEAETVLRTVTSATAFEETFCLDPSGRFDEKPDGATELVTVSELQDAINQTRGPCRVLIARGQTVPDFRITGRSVAFVGGFGRLDLPRPILQARSDKGSMFSFKRLRQPQITLDGLECRGDWDATTETGRQTDYPMDFISPATAHFTVWNCRFSGFHTVRATGDPNSDWTGGFGNTEVTNWSVYGIYVPRTAGGRLALLGCDIAQHPDALNHYPGSRNGLMNMQGPIRVPACRSFYCAASSFLSRGGWSGASDQECLRLNSRCIEGTHYTIERCTLEGGGNTVKMSGSSARNIEKPGNFLLDKVLMLAGGGKTGHFGRPHFGGTTLRNVLMVQLDVPSADSFSYRESLSLVPNNDDADNLSEPVALYNCSIMNLRTSANDEKDNPRLTGKAAFSNYTEENNLIHAPALATHAEDVYAPISTAQSLAGFVPRYKGTRPNFDFETGTLESAVPDQSTFQINYPAGTDLAYWESLPASDDQHGLHVDRRAYFAASGGFQVHFGPTTITLTNTSGDLWESGAKWTLRLDRKSQLPAMNTAFGNPTDSALPLPIPMTGSPAILNGPLQGRQAYDDFLGRVRPGPSETGRDHTGAPRPTTGGTRGAFHI